MVRDTIDVQLLQEERVLILKYGYPFEQIKAALLKASDNDVIVTVPMNTYELGYLIADLCRSLNHEEVPRTDLDFIIELIERLEYAESTGDGMLDILY